MNNNINNQNQNNFTVNFDYGAIIEEQLLRYSYKGVIVKCIDLPSENTTSESTNGQYYIKFSVPVETETYKIKTKNENGLVNVRNATGEELAKDFIDKVGRMLYGNMGDKEYEFARGMGIIRPKFEWRVRGKTDNDGETEATTDNQQFTTDQLIDKAFTISSNESLSDETSNEENSGLWTQEMGMEIYIAQKMGMEKIKQMDMDKVMGLKEKIDEFNRVNRIVDEYIEIKQKEDRGSIGNVEAEKEYREVYGKLTNLAKEYTKGKLIYEYDELLSFGGFDELEDIIEWLKSKCMEIREDVNENMSQDGII